MNEQQRKARLEQSTYNTAIGIGVCVDEGCDMQELKKWRTMLAEDAKSIPGVNRLKTFVVDGKWFLAANGDIHEIVSPPHEEVPKGAYVMQTEEFLKFAGIKDFSGRPIE